jgi:hypothetical protein
MTAILQEARNMSTFFFYLVKRISQLGNTVQLCEIAQGAHALRVQRLWLFHASTIALAFRTIAFTVRCCGAAKTGEEFSAGAALCGHNKLLRNLRFSWRSDTFAAIWNLRSQCRRATASPLDS